MRPTPGLYTEWVDDEAVVLDPSTNHVHYLNRPAAMVYALIQEFGFDEGIRTLNETYRGVRELQEELPSLIEALVLRGLVVDE